MTERGSVPDHPDIERPDAIPAPDESTPEQPVVQHSGTPLVEPAEPIESTQLTEPTGPDSGSSDDVRSV
jgi:hypothetical protein